MFVGQNLWVIKPNDCNRGRGVIISNKLDEIKRIVFENALGNDFSSNYAVFKPLEK